MDKTLLIKDFLTDPFRCLLITRPRRFGKTLNLSTLRHFFEKKPISIRELFEGLAISKYPDAMEHQGQYPVIYLIFKDLKGSSFQRALDGIQTLVGNECRRLMKGSEAVFDQDKHEKRNHFRIQKTGRRR